MAQMLLPVKAVIVPDESELDRGVWKGSVTFGAKQLSSGRLDSTLADIVARGDPPFVVELRHDSSQLLGFLPTRASLIQKGLATAQQPVSVRDDGPLGDFRKSKLRLWAGYGGCCRCSSSSQAGSSACTQSRSWPTRRRGCLARAR